MKLFWLITQTIGVFTGTLILTYSLIMLPSRLDDPPSSPPDEVTSLPTPKTEPEESPDNSPSSPPDEVTSLPTPTVTAIPSPVPVPTPTPTPTPSSPPDGFRLISFGPGVEVYKKYYLKGTKAPDYVTIVDLENATILSLCGRPYGTAGISRHELATYWNKGLKLNTKSRKLKVAVNGTWFLPAKDEINMTPGITLGLKCDGTIIDYGNPAKTKLFEYADTFSFDRNSATIQPYSKIIFDDPKQKDVIGVFRENAPIKKAMARDGRNLIGVRDAIGRNRYKTVLIFTTLEATQEEAYQVFKNFKPDKIGILDGGWSAQLIVDGNKEVKNLLIGMSVLERWIPHAILVYYGK